MNNNITLPTELIPLAAFLMRGGDGSSCYATFPAQFLDDVVEQLPEKDWAYHIVTIGYDNLLLHEREAIKEFIFKETPIQDAIKYRLQKKGFIVGEKIPSLIIDRFKMYHGWEFEKEE